MGRDKPMLELDGHTFLHRCAEALRPIAAPIVVVADIADRFPAADWTVVADCFPGAGPVGGIVTALRTLGQGAHVVVACDMPFLHTDLLRLLLDAVSDEFDAVVPWPDSGPEPLCAVYRSTCLPLLETYLANGGRSARKALASLRMRPIPEIDLRRADPELESFVNLNTPEDLRRHVVDRP